MGALYLKDLADKTRRGLRGRVEAGRSGGGNCLRLRRRDASSAADGEPDRGDAPDQRGAGRDRPPHLRRLRRRQVAEGDRARAEQREAFAGPSGQGLGPIDDQRQLAARHRHPQQRALRRQAGLEPPHLRQEPRHRQARLAAQSRGRLDHQGGAGAADRRSGALGPGEGAAARRCSKVQRLPREAAPAHAAVLPAQVRRAAAAASARSRRTTTAARPRATRAPATTA